MFGLVDGSSFDPVSVDLAESGVLDRYGVELIGANYEAIACAEDRELFAEAMASPDPLGGMAFAKSELARFITDPVELASADAIVTDLITFGEALARKVGGSAPVTTTTTTTTAPGPIVSPPNA